MLTVLLFRFPFPSPWGKELTEAVHELARDIANEYGFVWKIWLENRETGHAGGIYLFERAAAAERYREKHERRLSAIGFTGITANTFSVNTELSVLTMAAAALGQKRIDGRRRGAILTTNPRPARAAPVILHAIKGSRLCFRRPSPGPSSSQRPSSMRAWR
jgi:Putative mono-oxygenase ydhR